MGKLLSILVIFMVHQSIVTAETPPKCSYWIFDSGKILDCCNMPIAINKKITEPLHNELMNKTITVCDYYKKLAEEVNLQVFDRATYKNFAKKITNNTDWEPIIAKNIDYCLDLVPKIVDTFAKGTKMDADKCALKFAVTGICMGNSGFVDCPAKYLTDTTECKELKTKVKECIENPEEINKFFVLSSD